MNKLLGFVAAAQMLCLFANDYNSRHISIALVAAAAKGEDTFDVKTTSDFFGGDQTSLTMINGWKSVNKPSECSVNLVDSEDGTAVQDTHGLLLETWAPARRYLINDCSKLPSRIFRPYVGG